MAIINNGSVRIIRVPRIRNVEFEAPTAEELRDSFDLTEYVTQVHLFTAELAEQTETPRLAQGGIVYGPAGQDSIRAQLSPDCYIHYQSHDQSRPGFGDDLMDRIDYLLSVDQAHCDANQEFDASGLPIGGA